MNEHNDSAGLLSFVLERGERVLYSYDSTAKRLRRDGARQFFLPAAAAGIFLILVGSVCFSLLGKWAGVLAFLGMMLCATGLIFYAMFMRMARRAESCSLHVTDRAVITIREGTYARLPLCFISDAQVKREQRLAALPFDISMLEVEFIILEYKGEEMKIPYIENAPDAAKRIREAADSCKNRETSII